MKKSKGEIHTCTCSQCGHVHRTSEREIALFQGMTHALWRIFQWCKNHNRHEFRTFEVSHLLDSNTYNRFADWKMFGGLTYTPRGTDGKRLGKGYHGLNMERCEQFFANELKVPTRVWKNPLTGAIRPEEYKTAREIPHLSEFLDADKFYIANYRTPTV